MTPSHDSIEGTLADLGQVLLALLVLYSDEPEICVPRDWIAMWFRDVSGVLTVLRATRPPQRSINDAPASLSHHL
jgi:hypothetical protein